MFDRFVVPALEVEALRRKKLGVAQDPSITGRTAVQAAKMSGGRFSASTLKGVKGLHKRAPETYRKALAGELTSVAKIRAAADAEEVKKARGLRREELKNEINDREAKAAVRKAEAREAKTTADVLMKQMQETAALWVEAMNDGRYGKSDIEEQRELANGICETLFEHTTVEVDPEAIKAQIDVYTERLAGLTAGDGTQPAEEDA